MFYITYYKTFYLLTLYPRRDSNSHAFADAFETTVSTNSTTRANNFLTSHYVPRAGLEPAHTKVPDPLTTPAFKQANLISR